MSDTFVFMDEITVTYAPQNGQSFRCSKNFPKWNTPKGGAMKFEVIAPDGYPQPIFAIDHDKVGADSRWYSDINNGAVIAVNSENGGDGGHALYVGTLSKLPAGLDGSKTYTVKVYIAKTYSGLPTVSDADKLALIQKYAPRIKLARDERYFPCSTDWSFQYLERYKNGDGKYWLKTKTPLTSPSQPDHAGFSGQNNLADVPIYGFWVEKNGSFDITYYAYFAYNRGKEVASTVFGNHVGDWEHLTVRLSSALTPTKIFLSQHSGGDVIYWPDIPVVNDTHPVVYSAWGSHGFYAQAGDHVYNSLLGLSDSCSDGTNWDTWQKVETFKWPKAGLGASVWPRWMDNDFETPGSEPSSPAAGPVFRWGNEEEGGPIFGQYRLENGPTGPVSKTDVWDPNQFA